MEPSRSVLPDVNETDRFDTLTKAVAELRRDVGELAGQIIRDRDVLRHHALPRLERNHANLRQSVVALAEHDTEHHHTSPPHSRRPYRQGFHSATRQWIA